MAPKKINEHDKELWDAFIKDVKQLPSHKKIHNTQKTYYPVRPERPHAMPRLMNNEHFQHMLEKSLPLQGQGKTKRHTDKIHIDAKIDLHGMTETRAYDILKAFLHRMQHQSSKWVLVVTGKSGVLHDMVPKWLDAMADLVTHHSHAKPAHGGKGALYVRVKILSHR